MTETLYFDASAFGRVHEPGPDQRWVAEALRAGEVTISLLTTVEVRSVVNTKIRQGMPLAAAELLWQSLGLAVRATKVVELEAEDFDAARELLEHEVELRAGDALQLAVARRIEAHGVGVTLVTADRRQASVAQRLLDGVRLLE
ncbi:MAG TPA: type II toxin-antitoxin system VapC family toxin [Candidatus Dormibacteraeota bacterium]